MPGPEREGVVSPILTLMVGVAVGGATLTFLLGWRTRSEREELDEDRLMFGSVDVTLEELELERPFRERVLQPGVSALLQLFGRMAPQRNLETVQHNLEIAGRPFGWTVVDFLGFRLLSALVVAALGFLLMSLGDISGALRLLLTLVFAGLGFYLPVLWLGRRMRARQHAVLRALPDGLDMLNICVGAGLGFDQAMARIGERWDNPLSEEFNRVVAEIQLGKPRRQALLDLSNRTQVTEVESFVASIVQATQLGVSIARVLQSQAEQMRIIRRQRAEEAARQATIKLLFPLVFMIFPSMLAVLLGPAIPQILDAFSSL
jgi:tight adherence protein C